MVDIKQVQYCCSNEPFHEMFVPSRSNPGEFHRITVPLPDDAPEEWTCTCRGWQFRGTCSHLAMVSPCHWTELTGPEQQTDQQRDDQVCPRCGGSTDKELALA